MTDPAPSPLPAPLDVHLFQELVSRQWVIELRKMGCRLAISRSIREGRVPALAEAEGLARFLGVALVDDGPLPDPAPGGPAP